MPESVVSAGVLAALVRVVGVRNGPYAWRVAGLFAAGGLLRSANLGAGLSVPVSFLAVVPARDYGLGWPLAALCAAVYVSWFALPFCMSRWLPWSSRSLWALAFLTVVGYGSFAVFESSPPWLLGEHRPFGQLSVMAWLMDQDANPRAAFPSMHLALPTLAALVWSRWWWAYVVALGVVVVVTSEHWPVDVAGGVALAALSVRVGDVLSRKGVSWTAWFRQNVHHVGVRAGVGHSEP